MHAKVVNVLGTLTTTLLALVAAPASAQVSTTANGPYYATPSWDQKLTTNRFVILANWNGEAVLDRETGLVWERSPSPVTLAWPLAQVNCSNVTKGGRKGWRLPALAELASLVDPTVTAPSLPQGHPFTGVVSNFYITASSLPVVPAAVMFVNMSNGRTETSGYNLAAYVWCVRGGAGVDGNWYYGN
jgi:hypothetical protein